MTKLLPPNDVELSSVGEMTEEQMEKLFETSVLVDHYSFSRSRETGDVIVALSQSSDPINRTALVPLDAMLKAINLYLSQNQDIFNNDRD